MVESEYPLCRRVWFRDRPPRPVSGSLVLAVSRGAETTRVKELGRETFRYINVKILLHSVLENSFLFQLRMFLKCVAAIQAIEMSICWSSWEFVLNRTSFLQPLYQSAAGFLLS